MSSTSASHTSGFTDAGVTLPPEIQKHLGNLLKASYNEVLTAPVPDRFIQLLEQLDASEKQIRHNAKKDSDHD